MLAESLGALRHLVGRTSLTCFITHIFFVLPLLMSMSASLRKPADMLLSRLVITLAFYFCHDKFIVISSRRTYLDLIHHQI